MTTFYEELCTAAGAKYITLENKKQAILQVVRRWAENNKIINAALAKTISLEILVGPIIIPNLRISFFNRENDTLDHSEFQEWSKRLSEQMDDILPLREHLEGPMEDPEDLIDLCLPVKAYRFYSIMRHLFLCLFVFAILPLLPSNLTAPTFWQALAIGTAGGSFLELVVFCLNTSLHFRNRRRMARELLRQTQDIDRIFGEALLG